MDIAKHSNSLCLDVHIKSNVSIPRSISIAGPYATRQKVFIIKIYPVATTIGLARDLVTRCRDDLNGRTRLLGKVRNLTHFLVKFISHSLPFPQSNALLTWWQRDRAELRYRALKREWDVLEARRSSLSRAGSLAELNGETIDHEMRWVTDGLILLAINYQNAESEFGSSKKRALQTDLNHFKRD